MPFAEAEPGATGLELLLSLALKWGARCAASAWARRWHVSPAARCACSANRIGSLAASAGRLVAGGVADVCVFDPAATWRLVPEMLKSQGKHTPFSFASTGMALPGRVRATLVAGTVAYEVG